MASRGPQILENYRNKSTGVLSLITFVLACAGNYARVFTTLVEVPDKLVLVGCAHQFNIVLSAVLNTTILGQIVAYRSNKLKAS